MEPAEYERMARAERFHWWYRGLARLSRRLLERYRPSGGPLRLLDAGCGTGGALVDDLGAFGPAFGCELSGLALAYCRDRGLARVAQATITHLPHADSSFDLITCFDVLYERAVADDLAALIEMHRVLRTGGILLLRVPAYDWLRGHHDRVTHTARRYTTGQVEQLLRRSGMTPLHLTYVNMCLFPAAAAKRLLERAFRLAANRSDLEWGAGILSCPLRKLLEAEGAVAAGPGLPFGLSVVAVARKEIGA